jgi:hypothetical protein
VVYAALQGARTAVAGVADVVAVLKEQQTSSLERIRRQRR